MKLSFLLKAFVLALAMFLMVNVNFVFAGPIMNSMTSKKKSLEVAKALPTRDNSVHKHSVGVGIGQTFLLGDFEKNGTDGISPDFFYDYTASYSFGVLVNFHFWEYDYRDSSTQTTGLSLAIKSKLFNFDSFSPYILGGVGFYLPEVSPASEKKSTKLVFGTTMGAGAELVLNRHYKAGLLFQYHNPFDVKQDVGPDVEGSYYKLLVSLFYIF